MAWAICPKEVRLSGDTVVTWVASPDRLGWKSVDYNRSMPTIVSTTLLKLHRYFAFSPSPNLFGIAYAPSIIRLMLQDLNMALRLHQLKSKLKFLERHYEHLQHTVQRLQPPVHILNRKSKSHRGRLFGFGLVALFVISWSYFLYQGFSSYGSRREGWSCNPIHNATLGVRSSKF